MTIDRMPWNSPFRKLPNWICPTCGQGRLVEKAKSINILETGPSIKLHGSDDWDPEWVAERFSGFLHCNNSECQEVVSISGNGGVVYFEEEDIDGHPYLIPKSEFEVKSICPSPHLFELKVYYPEKVCKRLLEAFELFWADFDSCANKLRIAVEAMLTERKIPNFAKAVPGKPRRKLMLHARIALYRSKNSEVADCLEAIKWLGNHGSHDTDGLKLEDVMIAADLIEHVLNITYNKSIAHHKKAKKINKKKGPIK